MKKIQKTKKGQALLVAILLTAIIGSAILGISAVAFRQIATVEKYTSGTIAFYAAESGVEEGLLRFRFDKNVEIPENITTYSDDILLERKPKNSYRNFLTENPMRPHSSVDGVSGNYLASDRRQIYDLRVYYKQKYTGDDLATPIGEITGADLAKTGYSADYKIAKDNAETFTILSGDAEGANNIYLYWKWASASCHMVGRAVEIKAKVVDATGSGDDEYTSLFSDPRPGCPKPRNATPATSSASYPNVYQASSGGEIKAAMGISAKTVLSITLKPVGNTATSGDGIFFGFDQGDISTKNGRTAGLTSTIDSTGYFAGTSRKISANINRQNGTILDLFQYVIYKGGE